MLVLKRLIAFVATSVTPVLRRRGACARRPASRSPGSSGCSRRATPVMDDIVWFHDFLLWLITAITLFVLALLLIVIVQVQCARQSDAVAHHPQHAASR